MRRAFLAFLFALGLHASAAWAHAFLDRAVPPAGGVVTVAPPALTLRFTEAVEPAFCVIELLDPAGAPVRLPAPVAVDVRTLEVGLPALRPGSYTVIWRVTSVDTHRTEGRFRFTIGP